MTQLVLVLDLPMCPIEVKSEVKYWCVAEKIKEFLVFHRGMNTFWLKCSWHTHLFKTFIFIVSPYYDDLRIRIWKNSVKNPEIDLWDCVKAWAYFQTYMVYVLKYMT